MFKLYLDKLGKEPQHVQEIGLRINAPKSTFATDEVECLLGYTFTLYGSDRTEKLSAILAL